MFQLSRHSLAVAVGSILAFAGTGGAGAGTPSGPYQIFQYCPYQVNPDVGTCVVAKVNGGSFTIGNAVVPINATITLQGGTIDLGDSPLFSAVGAPSLSPTPLEVPGGLLGLMTPASNWPGPLVTLFWNIVNSVNGVTATAELIDDGSAHSTLVYAIFPPDEGDATAVRLPIRVHLQNPFLGDSCYIGSAQSPIVLNLVANTTNPPPPNQPISGVIGTFDSQATTNPDGFINFINGGTLVDNSFAVPAASGCGNLALGLPILTPILEALVSGAVNLKEGLPAAAGKNTAIMVNDVTIASADYVRASEQ